MNETELRSELEKNQTLAERAEFATLELISDYGFAKSPNPQKAIACISEKDSSTEAVQSFTWFAEYSRICTLIEIASDYIEAIKNLAESAVNVQSKSPLTNADQSK